MSTKEKQTAFSLLINKELELPETVFIRDIENRVFQGIVLQCLASIEDIAFLEGGFIDNMFSRANVEGIKGISTEQDSKSHSVSVKIEVNISYGISIPDKAEEIQVKIAEELTRLTGLHVSCVHVVFKNIINSSPKKRLTHQNEPEVEKEYAADWE